MKLHSRAARNKSKSQTPRTSRWTEGRSEAATTTDAGTAPGGGCTGSTDGGAAPAEDAADAPAGTEGTAEVRPAPHSLAFWAPLAPPSHSTDGQWGLTEALAPPRPPTQPCNHDFLFQKAAEGAGGEGDAEGVTKPSWAHHCSGWKFRKSHLPKNHLVRPQALARCWMPKP